MEVGSAVPVEPHGRARMLDQRWSSPSLIRRLLEKGPGSFPIANAFPRNELHSASGS